MADDNVINLEAKRAESLQAQPEAATGADAPAPPTPLDSAIAQIGGKGGEGGGAEKPPANGSKKGEKPPKVIDWGKFNYLIENFALIYGTDEVWDDHARIMMKIAAMGHAHGSDMVRMWKLSDRRRTVMPQDIVFDPTMTALEHQINMFGGLSMQPVEGDVEVFLELVQFLTSRASDAIEASVRADENDAIMHYVLCWLAYPLQNKGAKLRTAIIMHGDEGAGKNFLFDTVVAIYGKYGTLVGQDELEDKFNDWRSCKMFVVGDEVSSRSELVHNKNRLKSLITSETVLINPKGLMRREERNHINVAFLSNELQPLALDNSDRRYLVIYTPRAREFEFYKKLKEWKANGGVAALYHYLLNYNLEGFDPFAPAPSTAAKTDLIDLNRKSPERFWLEWSGGQLDLPYHPCSLAQAYRAYLKYAQRTGDRFPVQRNLFTRMVMRMGEYSGKFVREKVMKIDPLNNKCERMLLTIEPPDAAQGAWAKDCVETFEKALSKYLGLGPHSPMEGDSR